MFPRSAATTMPITKTSIREASVKINVLQTRDAKFAYIFEYNTPILSQQKKFKVENFKSLPVCPYTLRTPKFGSHPENFSENILSLIPCV